MEQFIKLSEVLTEMEKKDHRGEPIPFNIEVFTYNRTHKKDCRRMQLQGYIWAKVAKVDPAVKTQAGTTKRKRLPRTLTLVHPETGDVRTIHAVLIHRFNGKMMRY
ncbi:hypothetical protein V6R21_19920 [Limibacter armeniacum]|uniref:hypothetical protein n=1 Tax=Limibacter armeniacum TaxID=466084 RepID=UPI002FE6022E